LLWLRGWTAPTNCPPPLPPGCTTPPSPAASGPQLADAHRAWRQPPRGPCAMAA
jgi:hypothetical protein